MTVVLRAEGVSKWFGIGPARVTPVDGVSLAVERGDVVLLSGPSGSGKSTLLHLVAGFLRPDVGTVTWRGGTGSRPDWSTVAVVPQSLGLLPELTVAENVALPLVAGGRPPAGAQAQVHTALESLDVGHLAGRLVGEASLGQQQRVAVARAVVGRPAIIVADEPTSRQDGDHAHLVLDVLTALAADGTAVVMAGHDPRLTAVATRLGHLVAGRLVAG